ncbi:MAG: pilus assembly protein N-terminal domain-containing protein, partial [Alphaproteobacteria bacterium]|nr:pilus assembly protein N-terminal domain-containing protein [Alphaproteobacteria bacterium]
MSKISDYLNNILIFLACLIMITLIGRAHASDLQVISASQQVITIEQNRGNLIRLPQAAKTVFIANSEIAEVMVRSPKLV